MFDEYGRKIKLLEVKRIIEEQSDDEHCITATQIADKLKAMGIPTARKAIYDDIKALNRFMSQLTNGRPLMLLALRRMR